MEIKYRLHDKDGITIGYEKHIKNEHGCYQILQTSLRGDFLDTDTMNVRDGFFMAATYKSASLCKTDINGLEIFENDIVWDKENSSRNKIVYDSNTCAFLMSGIRDEWDDFLYKYRINTLEVMGNILDNPDLII